MYMHNVRVAILFCQTMYMDTVCVCNHPTIKVRGFDVRSTNARLFFTKGHIISEQEKASAINPPHKTTGVGKLHPSPIIPQQPACRMAYVIYWVHTPCCIHTHTFCNAKSILFGCIYIYIYIYTETWIKSITCTNFHECFRHIQVAWVLVCWQMLLTKV